MPTATDRTRAETEAALLAELAEVQRQLDACAEESDANYRRRYELLERGRAMDPPVPVRSMAEAMGQPEGAVGQALHKGRKRRAS